MKAIKNGALTVASYTYDAFGRRVVQATATGSTYFYYNLAGQVVTEKNQANVWTTGYIYLYGQMVAQYSGGLTGTTYFAHADHLGSTRVLTKVDKTPQAGYDFMPFGESASADTTTTHKFTGLERDQKDGEPGLDHTLFRKYSALCGRWLSPDPLFGSPGAPQSLNRYAYVRNDPVNLVDPLGLRCQVFYFDAILKHYKVWRPWPTEPKENPEPGPPQLVAEYTGTLIVSYCEVGTRGLGPRGGGRGAAQNAQGQKGNIINTKQLDECVREFFGVELRDFQEARAGQNGYFVGFGPDSFTKRGERTGNNFEFRIVANAMHGTPWTTMMSFSWLTGDVAVGFMSDSNPFLTYTANDRSPEAIVTTQIHELAHSLSRITGVGRNLPNRQHDLIRLFLECVFSQ